jgi:hypothetical protein
LEEHIASTFRTEEYAKQQNGMKQKAAVLAACDMFLRNIS